MSREILGCLINSYNHDTFPLFVPKKMVSDIYRYKAIDDITFKMNQGNVIYIPEMDVTYIFKYINGVDKRYCVIYDTIRFINVISFSTCVIPNMNEYFSYSLNANPTSTDCILNLKLNGFFDPNIKYSNLPQLQN